jgi:hypothetical protein
VYDYYLGGIEMVSRRRSGIFRLVLYERRRKVPIGIAKVAITVLGALHEPVAICFGLEAVREYLIVAFHIITVIVA